MEYFDRSLPCRECSRPFIWTAGEQQFYQEKGLTNLPARCPECRASRKARLGLSDRAQSEVVCAQCGLATTVPFIPRNGNPVYCSRCFDALRHQQQVADSAAAAG